MSGASCFMLSMICCRTIRFLGARSATPGGGEGDGEDVGKSGILPTSGTGCPMLRLSRPRLQASLQNSGISSSGLEPAWYVWSWALMHASSNSSDVDTSSTFSIMTARQTAEAGSATPASLENDCEDSALDVTLGTADSECSPMDCLSPTPHHVPMWLLHVVSPARLNLPVAGGGMTRLLAVEPDKKKYVQRADTPECLLRSFSVASSARSTQILLTILDTSTWKFTPNALKYVLLMQLPSAFISLGSKAKATKRLWRCPTSEHQQGILVALM
mmetsp:Transcript_5160/g.9884  ORF Transcript_5160/g.9884 Transcript_5160/m.9884 type:complete len:273 (+) Transcript_5160:171-989(+)